MHQTFENPSPHLAVFDTPIVTYNTALLENQSCIRATTSTFYILIRNFKLSNNEIVLFEHK